MARIRKQTPVATAAASKRTPVLPAAAPKRTPVPSVPKRIRATRAKAEAVSGVEMAPPLVASVTPQARKLFYGDNIEVLRDKIPTESVDLCYIDPPFNSKRNYNQIYNNVGAEDRAQSQAFIDTWTWDEQANQGYEEIITNAGNRFAAQTIELIKGLRAVLNEGSLLAYIVSITLRVVEIQRVLKDSGSFYLHCDPTASHYLKLVLDSVFCSAGRGGDFKNEIIWRRTGAHGARRRFGPIHDVILFYTKNAKTYFFNRVKRPYMRGHVESRYTKDENGYKFTSGGNILTGSGKTEGESGQPWRGFDPSAKNRHWAIPSDIAEQIEDEDFDKLGVLAKLERLYEEGLIEIFPDQVWPQPVRYLNPDKAGQPIQDIWAYQPYTEKTVFGTNKGIDADVAWLGPTDPERLGYETQKPEGLLERIIESSCPAGGTVLDAYCGCGTSVFVAEKLKRSWIGIDITYQSISIVLERLETKFGKAAVDAVVLDGIPQDMASATALAHKKDDRVRKEFEKWAVLTYTNNRAIVNTKKGADGGIDGLVYFLTSKTETAKLIAQVKSGGVGRKDIATLRGDMEKAKAPLGVLITLEQPTSVMKTEAASAGIYNHELTGNKYPRIQIVTIQEIIENHKRLDLPLSLDVLKKAASEVKEQQLQLGLGNPK